MSLWLGAPGLQPPEGLTPLELVRWFSSRFPRPSNAQALAALDAFAWDQASTSGMGPAGEAWWPPDGVLPRMRLLAWGWRRKGDRFKSPSDASWWKSIYDYPLWNPLETLADQAERAGDPLPAFVWSDELAAGDVAELSRSLPQVVGEDLPPVNEAPCPRWLIPPGRGQSPVPNPSCASKGRDELEKVIPKLPVTQSYDWLLWLGLIYLALEDQ